MSSDAGEPTADDRDPVIDEVLPDEVQEALADAGYTLEVREDLPYDVVAATRGDDVFLFVEHGDDSPLEVYAVDPEGSAEFAFEGVLLYGGDDEVNWEMVLEYMEGFVDSGGFEAAAALGDVAVEDREAAYEEAIEASGLSEEEIADAFDAGIGESRGSGTGDQRGFEAT